MTPDSSSQSGPEYSVRVTPEDLQTALARALATADAGLVAPEFAAQIDVLAPTRPELGDWTTPVALRAAASPAKRTELAAHLCTELRTFPEVADAVIAGMSLEARPLQWRDAWGPCHVENLRDALLHVITETATHAGHLDAARELIDGRQHLVLE